MTIIRFPSPDDGVVADNTTPVVADDAALRLTIVEGGKSGRIVELWQEDFLVCTLTRDGDCIWAVTAGNDPSFSACPVI